MTKKHKEVCASCGKSFKRVSKHVKYCTNGPVYSDSDKTFSLDETIAFAEDRLERMKQFVAELKNIKERMKYGAKP